MNSYNVIDATKLFLINMKSSFVHNLKLICILFGGVILSMVTYKGIQAIYGANYMIDEYYDLYGLKELSINEQFTIRVMHPGDVSTLKNFVEHYSLCQDVYEILIVSEDDTTATDVQFVYEHTHSKVNFADAKDIKISTKAVLLLDADVFVTCEDLKFTYNVWTSSVDSIVGYFPRLHVTEKNSKDDHQFSLKYLNSYYVWWYQRYSMLLTSGAMIHKRYLLDFMSDNVVSRKLRYLIEENSECEYITMSLFIAYSKGSNPVWVQVPYFIDDHAKLTTPYHNSHHSHQNHNNDLEHHDQKKKSKDDIRSECLNQMTEILMMHGDRALPSYSTHKAVKAKDVLFWS